MKKRYARILAATLSAAMVFTSAPTAAFATEISVSEDAVEAEGVAPATAADVDALFPSNNLVVEYGDDVIKDVKPEIPVTVWDGSDVAYDPSSSVTGAAIASAKSSVDKTLAALNVGDTATITIAVKVDGVSTIDYSGIKVANTTYTRDESNNEYVTRTIKVTCVKATTMAGEVSQIAPKFTATVAVTAPYGTTKTTDAEITAGGGSAVLAAWSVKSLSAAVSTTKATEIVKNGVVLTTESLVEYVDNYDIEGYVKDTLGEGYTYNAATKCVEYVADVTIAKAAVEAADIVFPTGFVAGTTVCVGDDLTKKTLTTVADQGVTFAVTDVTNNGSSMTGGTIATDAGRQTVEVTATADDNHIISNGPAKKTFRIDVEKKTIEDSELTPYLTEALKKVPYGTGVTYGTWATGVAALPKNNTLLNYSLSDTSLTDKIMTPGSHTVTLKVVVADPTKYQLKGGKSYREVNVTFEVLEPAITFVTKAAVGTSTTWPTDFTGTATAYTIEPGNDATYVTLGAVFTDPACPVDAGIEVKYQWYKDGVAIANATDKTYAVPNTAIGSAVYTCKAKYEFKDTVVAANKEKVQGYAKAEYVTEPVTVAVSKTTAVDLDTGNTVLGNGVGNKALTYGDVDVQVPLTFTTADALQGVKAYITDGKGTKTEVPSARIIKTSGTIGTADDFVYSIVLPNGLDASGMNDAGTAQVADYTLTVEITTTGTADGKAYTDVAAVSSPKFVIQKKILAVPAARTTKETSYEYGVKASQIEVLVGGKACEYGTFTIELVNDVDRYITVDEATTGPIDLVFNPTEATKKNYDTTAYDGLNVTVTVTPKKLTIQPKELQLTLGDSLPSIASLQKAYTVTGLVGDDTAEKIVKSVEIAYEGGTEEDIKTVGTVKNALVLTATLFDETANANYIKDEKDANIVVEATAPTTPPTVKPTPAPVKQATAAAPKAAKAKAKVKVGKKYTLKLKYASAAAKKTVKKVTWKSSKKSVATVSSKGKVTAKKAGKATITATITFKDGSKKKVKFTVTVK